MDRLAPAADKTGEIADSSGQNGLDALAHAARHHRRGSAGADGNNHVAAIDNRRKNKGRMRQVVHHIHGQADRLRPRRHRGPDVARARAQDRNHPAEIGSQRVASHKLNPRRIGGVQGAHIMIAVGCVPANARACRCQQAQFRPRQITRSDKHYGTGSQIEKHRQESHTILASPTCGVDWNYFLYMSRSTPAKRNLFLLYCSATIEFSPPKAKGQRCIFSTTIPQAPPCVALIRPKEFRSGKFSPMGAWMRPPWITSTRSRPRASTFSGKRSRGCSSWRCCGRWVR